MSESTHRGIVAGVDGSPGSTAALRWAAQEAELRNVPLTLLLARGGGWWTRGHHERADHVVHDALAVVAETTGASAPEVLTATVAESAMSALVEFSREATMVVVGRRGDVTSGGPPLGSVSSALVRHCHCPVAVIHNQSPSRPERAAAPVMVGVDGSRGAELATAIAFEEASLRQVDLVALHVWKDASPLAVAGIGADGAATPALMAVEMEALAERLAGWGERYPDVSVHRFVVRDNEPARQIVDQACTAQLVVVGGRGLGGLAGTLLGSVSAAVLQLVQIPIIVARQL